jgi:uncharacterized membrane protein YesL
VPGDYGHGILGRLTAYLYWLVVVTVLLVLTVLPTLVLAALLDRSTANIGLVVLAAIPVGPALSAALYATRDRERSEGLTPARSFWRGYRQNWADVLRIWVPALVVLAIVAYVVANAGAAGVSGLHAVVLLVVAAVVLTLALHAVAIVSFYNFRVRDVVRLSAYYLGRFPLVTLGVVSLLVVAGAVVWFLSEAGLALLGGVWVVFWYRNDARMLDEVRDRYTATPA